MYFSLESFCALTINVCVCVFISYILYIYIYPMYSIFYILYRITLGVHVFYDT